jgi:hypothetical protein
VTGAGAREPYVPPEVREADREDAPAWALAALENAHDGECGLLSGGTCSDEAHADKCCPRCATADRICCWLLDWVECSDCAGEGEVLEADWYDDDDVGARCPTCDGYGGWYACTCDEEGKHR